MVGRGRVTHTQILMCMLHQQWYMPCKGTHTHTHSTSTMVYIHIYTPHQHCYMTCINYSTHSSLSFAQAGSASRWSSTRAASLAPAALEMSCRPCMRFCSTETLRISSSSSSCCAINAVRLRSKKGIPKSSSAAGQRHLGSCDNGHNLCC